MTLDEYAQKVGDALRAAHNGKDRAALERTFADADAKIDAFLVQKRLDFWTKVEAATRAGRWRTEDQANSSLVALMQAIWQGIADRKGK